MKIDFPRLSMAAMGCLFAVGCSGQPEPGWAQQQIINGTPVGDNDLRSTLMVGSNTNSLCTGTLIAPTVILTAAHCVDPEYLKSKSTGPKVDKVIYNYSFVRDLIAATQAGQKPFLHAASGEFHEGWSTSCGFPGQCNDVAVIHLATPITDHPIQKLATSDVIDKLSAGTQLLTAGYGNSAANATDQGVLRKGMEKLDQVGSWEVTAGQSGPNRSCHGDSGGPIFAGPTDEYQIGIASRVTDSSGCTGMAAFTRVDKYLDWINAHMGDPAPPADGGVGDASSPGGMDAGQVDGSPGTVDAGNTDASTGRMDAGTGGNTGGDAGAPHHGPDSGGCSFAPGGGQAGVGLGMLLFVLLLTAVRLTRTNSFSSSKRIDR